MSDVFWFIFGILGYITIAWATVVVASSVRDWEQEGDGGWQYTLGGFWPITVIAIISWGIFKTGDMLGGRIRENREKKEAIRPSPIPISQQCTQTGCTDRADPPEGPFCRNHDWATAEHARNPRAYR